MFRIITAVCALVLLLPSAFSQVSVRSLDGNATNLTIRTGRMVGGFNLIGGTNLARTGVTGLEPALTFLTNNIGSGMATNAIGRFQDAGTNLSIFTAGSPPKRVFDGENSYLLYHDGVTTSFDFGDGKFKDVGNVESGDIALRTLSDTNGIVNFNWNGAFPTFPAGLQAQSIEGAGATAGVLILKNADGSVTNVYADENGVIAPRYLGNVGQATNSAGVAIDDLAGGSGGSSNEYWTSHTGAVGGANLSSGSSTYGPTTDHALIQELLNRGTSGIPMKVWVDGKYGTSNLTYYSGTTIEGVTPEYGFILRPGVNAPLFMNSSPSRVAVTNGNIAFKKLTLNGNGNAQSNLTQTVAASNTCNSIISAFGVTNLVVENVTLLEPAAFAFHAANVTNVYIANVFGAVSSNRLGTDVIHFNGPAADIVIENSGGHAYDDVVAFNANDGNSGVLGNQLGPHVGTGPIVNVRADVVLKGSLYGARVFSTTALMDNIFIRVRGTCTDHGFVGDQYDGSGGNFGQVEVDYDVRPGTAVVALDPAIHIDGNWKQFKLTAKRNGWKDGRSLIYFKPNTVMQQFDFDGLSHDTNVLAFNNWITNSGSLQSVKAKVNWKQTSGTNYFLDNRNGTIEAMTADYVGPERIVLGDQPSIPLIRYGSGGGASTFTNFSAFMDTFDDVPGTVVTNHTPEKGTWVAGTSTFEIESGNIAHGFSGLDYIIGEASVADGTITVTVDPDSASTTFSLVPRFVQLVPANYIELSLIFLNNNGGTESWSLVSWSAGVATYLDTIEPGVSGTSPFEIKVVQSGASIRVYRAGVLLLTGVATAHATATKFGFVTLDENLFISDVRYTASSVVNLGPGFLLSSPAGVLDTTFNGSQLTNIIATDSNALPKSGGVMSGGLGAIGLTNAGPTYALGPLIQTNGTAGVGSTNSPNGWSIQSGIATNGGFRAQGNGAITDTLSVSNAFIIGMPGNVGGYLQKIGSGGISANWQWNAGTSEIYNGANAGVQLRSANSHTLRVTATAAFVDQKATIGGTLTVSTTATGNVGAGEDNLISYSVPAATASVDGQYLEFDVWGTCAANTNPKQIKVVFGATTLLDTTAIVLNGNDWRGHGKIVRTGAATQTATCEFTVGGTLLSAVNSTISDTTSPAETLSGAITFKCTGTSTVAPADNDIVQNGLVLKWYPTQ